MWTDLRLLDSPPGRIVRTDTGLLPFNHDILDILDTSLSLSISTTIKKSEGTHKYTIPSIKHRPFILLFRQILTPVLTYVISATHHARGHLPDFCISKQASFSRSSPPVRARARTLSFMQSCFRLPRGTSDTGSETSRSSWSKG